MGSTDSRKTAKNLDFPPLIIHILRCMVIFKLNFIFKLSELRGSQWGQPIAVKRPKI